jgi:hypothetical protein
MNLGREVLAQLAGVPHRADWKACTETTPEQEARAERFKAAFAAFDDVAGGSSGAADGGGTGGG